MTSFFSLPNIRGFYDFLNNYLGNYNTKIELYNCDKIEQVCDNLSFNIADLFNILGDSHCKNMVNNPYIREVFNLTLKNYLKKTDKYDIIFIIDTEFLIYDISDLNDSILGFCIVKKGECKVDPEYYGIKLICALEGVGKILIGLYIYCCNLNNQKYGLLELGGSFYNIAGYKAYTKFGFIYDDDDELFNLCFDIENNLPMKVDTDDNTSVVMQYLPDIIQGKKKFTNKIIKDNSDIEFKEITDMFYEIQQDKLNGKQIDEDEDDENFYNDFCRDSTDIEIQDIKNIKIDLTIKDYVSNVMSISKKRKNINIEDYNIPSKKIVRYYTKSRKSKKITKSNTHLSAKHKTKTLAANKTHLSKKRKSVDNKLPYSSFSNNTVLPVINPISRTGPFSAPVSAPNSLSSNPFSAPVSDPSSLRNSPLTDLWGKVIK